MQVAFVGRPKHVEQACAVFFELLRPDLESRGLEPLTSAMRGRCKGFAAVHYRSKTRLNKPNPRIVPPRTVAFVLAGRRQIVVSCIRKY